MRMRDLSSLALTIGCAVAAGPALAQGAKSPIACNVLTEKDAAAIVGEPLGSVLREETRPTAQNGHRHDSVCGYFPKGYDIRKADRPPERGLELQLYARRSKDDSKEFYDAALGMAEQRSKTPKSGTKPAPLPGTGEAAFLQARKLEPQPGNVYDIAIVRVLKGNVMAQITAWKKGAPADEVAKAAAKHVASRLP